MRALFTEWVLKKAKGAWDNSSTIVKIFILWAFGPALMSYLTMDFRKEFKNEILAEAQQNTAMIYNPMMQDKSAQITALTLSVQDLSTQLTNTRTEIKEDIRELRSAVMTRLNHQP